MKMKVNKAILLLVLIFSLTVLCDTFSEVNACDISLPDADLPEPPS